MNKTHLVFYLWVPKDFDKNVSYTYNIHKECLKHYCKIFDDVVVVFGMDDINDTETLISIEHDFIEMGFKGNLRFKVIENNPLIREASTFEDEVMKKLDKLDGITFFAHGKGMSNVNRGTIDGQEVNKESLYEWICAMYFFSLEYVDEVKKTLIANLRIAYGSLLSYNTNFWKTPSWQFNGSFFWLNTKKLYDHCKVNKIHIPQCTDRTYAEGMLWKLLPFDFNYIESHKTWYMDTDKTSITLYNNADEWIRATCYDDDYNAFMNFYNTIKERAKIDNSDE